MNSVNGLKFDPTIINSFSKNTLPNVSKFQLWINNIFNLFKTICNYLINKKYSDK